MDRESTAAIISDVERAVNLIDRFADPEIYRLLDELKVAFREKNEEGVREKARQIVDYGRYAAVVEEADRLLR